MIKNKIEEDYLKLNKEILCREFIKYLAYWGHDEKYIAKALAEIVEVLYEE